MIQLYEFAVSGNCHKVRLLLSLLGKQYQSIAVSGPQKEHKSAEFLRKNPFGQVPVLQDGEHQIRDSQAILVYLAKSYGADHWLPAAPAAMAAVIAWLSTAANEIARGPAALRVHYKFDRPINVAEAESISTNVLQVLQNRLQDHDWLAGTEISIADIAIYSYVALTPEARLDLQAYPAVRAWLSRIQSLPGYIGMDGMWQA
ncbi:glutathione S-transferase family protein [Undibacterium sp. TJN19]|uniref:glutathione S-transferase family protein n=1 Tax=Undibacterium sp. TJN19 TaxID=3413055 RepID=UPI003BF0C7EB